MLFIEIVALLVVATVLITAIIAIGRPIAEIMAQKAHYKFKGIDSEAEVKLTKRIEGLEEELRSTKSQLNELKESVEFSNKMGTDSAPNEASSGAQALTIKDPNKVEN